MVTLVTGGAGFIGSHVVDHLADAGAHVRVLDVLHPGAHACVPDYLRDDVEYVWGDAREPAVVERALRGVDAVSHQAAMVGLGTDFADVGDYVSHNDVGTAAVLQAMHHVGFRGRLVLASSMVVYGEGRYECATHGIVRPAPRLASRLEAGDFEVRCPRCDGPLESRAVPESAVLDPRNVYAATKLHQEHLCAVFGREHGLPVTALRYHNVYGPRMPASTPYAGVASLFRSALEVGAAPRVFEDGRQRRDFVHVAALTVDAPVDGPVNIASGHPCSILEMAEAVASAFGSAAPRPVVTGGFRLGDVRHVYASTDHARDSLGFVASIHPRDGLRQFARDPMRIPLR
jgi:dTDP-L-rhamnose 4-epimerase